MEQIIFYAFALTAIASATMVVLSVNPVRAVLFLVLTFVAMAGVWILLHAEFLALILVLVYVGAVMTLFLFVVMMLNVNTVSQREGFVRHLPLAAMIVLLIASVMGVAIFRAHFASLQPVTNEVNNMAALGSVLYTAYVYPFEMAGVLLLTAIIAAISLTHRTAKNRKEQNPNQQMAAQSRRRVRLVK